MSENQLREAFTLMKQGDKAGASRLVQSVLREDRSNLNAWWLFANLLEDEDKVVKALEKVLTLNPEHPGARKKLAALRPEYAHLVQESSTEKEKPKKIDPSAAYWDKLNRPAKPQSPSWNFAAPIIRTFGWRLGGRLVLLIVGFVFVTVYSAFNFVVDVFTPDVVVDIYTTNSILMDMENTPESVAQAYFEAYFREDTVALEAITCSASKTALASQIAEFSERHPDKVSVDFSQTSFNLDESEVDTAYVSIHGITVISERGSDFTINWADLATYEGADFYGLYLEKIGDTWLVCQE